jgi:hypothetical protein
MRHDGTLNGLWIVRTGEAPASTPLLARVHNEVYVLAFTNALKANRCSDALGEGGRPFYVCRANIDGVVRELRDAGARGFIVDYDAGLASFTSAHELPTGERWTLERR